MPLGPEAAVQQTAGLQGGSSLKNSACPTSAIAVKYLWRRCSFIRAREQDKTDSVAAMISRALPASTEPNVPLLLQVTLIHRREYPIKRFWLTSSRRIRRVAIKVSPSS
jgi:hypothetical protein